MTPQLLTPELLKRFDQTLHSAGAPIIRAWRPGLDDGQIDALTRPHSFELPDEARVWWRWHDGGGREEITPNRVATTLQRTLEVFGAVRGAMLDAQGVDMRLMPVSEQPWIFFDCSGARDAPVPIYVGGHGESDRYALPSIGELVAIWIDLIEIGAYAIDDSGAWKDTNWDLLPARVQQLGVY